MIRELWRYLTGRPAIAFARPWRPPAVLLVAPAGTPLPTSGGDPWAVLAGDVPAGWTPLGTAEPEHVRAVPLAPRASDAERNRLYGVNLEKYTDPEGNPL